MQGHTEETKLRNRALVWFVRLLLPGAAIFLIVSSARLVTTCLVTTRRVWTTS